MREIELKCRRCKYKWTFRGKAKFYASCPRCRTSISLKQAKEEKPKFLKAKAEGKPSNDKGYTNENVAT